VEGEIINLDQFFGQGVINDEKTMIRITWREEISRFG